MRVVQPELKADGVYTKESQLQSNPRYTVTHNGYVVGLLNEGKWTAPICVKDSVISETQMHEVLQMVYLAIMAIEDAQDKEQGS